MLWQLCWCCDSCVGIVTATLVQLQQLYCADADSCVGATTVEVFMVLLWQLFCVGVVTAVLCWRHVVLMLCWVIAVTAVLCWRYVVLMLCWVIAVTAELYCCCPLLVVSCVVEACKWRCQPGCAPGVATHLPCVPTFSVGGPPLSRTSHSWPHAVEQTSCTTLHSNMPLRKNSLLHWSHRNRCQVHLGNHCWGTGLFSCKSEILSEGPTPHKLLLL